MPGNPCSHCKFEGICIAQNALCKAVLLAWAGDEEVPQCPFKVESNYVKGVYV